MKKRTSSMNLFVSITFVFILLMTLVIANMGTSHQESKTLNPGKIIFMADDNNNTFSDLSRNMSMQTGT
jgi:hypothetical protein